MVVAARNNGPLLDCRTCCGAAWTRRKVMDDVPFLSKPATMSFVGVASSSRSPTASLHPQGSHTHPDGNLIGLFAGDWATEEKTSFLAEAFTIFSSLQKIASDEHQRQQEASKAPNNSIGSFLPPLQTLQYYHRIANLYRDALRRYMEVLESFDNHDDQPDLELAHSIHTILHLAEIIYLPADGRGTGVVGEEILHWLNSFDFAPRTEEGQEIAQSAAPHEHPAFWDYILRCVLRGFHSSAASLLSSLATSHVSPTLCHTAKRVQQLLSSTPRSTAFGLEHDFIAAHRKWVGQIRSLLSRLEQDMDEAEAELTKANQDSTREQIEDVRLEYEAQFRCVLELMAGVKERVFEACDDWREALGAWGVLVQPAMKRDDVPEVMHIIIEAFPVDSTLPSESILVSLAQGNPLGACERSHSYDPWLAAHLTDLFHHTSVLDDAQQSTTTTTINGASLRTSYVTQYANTILDDQGLWRLAVDYLSYCGPNARARMQCILLDVPLTGAHAPPSRAEPKRAEDVEAEAHDEEMDQDEEDPDEAALERKEKREAERAAKRVGQEYNVAMEIIETCIELGMDQEARAVCKQMASEMAKQNRIGPALAYCVRANDVRQIKRIADTILATFVDQGSHAFCQAVDSIPFSLIDPSLADKDSSSLIKSHPSLSGRLLFLARYRDVQLLQEQADYQAVASVLMELLTSHAAPEPFWAILLADCIPLLRLDQDVLGPDDNVELLRILERVLTAASETPRQQEYYLGMLQRLLKPGKSHANPGLVSDDNDDDWEAGRASFDGSAALHTLEGLRLALARHLARTVVQDRGAIERLPLGMVE